MDGGISDARGAETEGSEGFCNGLASLWAFLVSIGAIERCVMYFKAV